MGQGTSLGNAVLLPRAGSGKAIGTQWLFLSLIRPGKLDGEQPDQVTSEPRFCCSASFVARGEAGNCSPVTC